MLSKADLAAPARLAYVTQGEKLDREAVDWSTAREFASLREALHHAVTEESPASLHAVIQTGSGQIVTPDEIDALWDSVQGP